MRVLPVAEVLDLLEDHGEAGREDLAADLVEVGGDLGVVGGDRAERIGGQLLAELRRDATELPELADELGIVPRAGHGRHPGAVAGRRAEEGRPADVDHLDRLVDPDEPGADLGGERLDVDDDHVDEADVVLDELLQLGRHVAAGKDAGVDRGMERLDLAADEGRDVGQLGDRADLDAVGGERLAGPVGREHLDIEGSQVAREVRDPIAGSD